MSASDPLDRLNELAPRIARVTGEKPGDIANALLVRVQINALLQLLVSRGVFTREDWSAAEMAEAQRIGEVLELELSEEDLA